MSVPPVKRLRWAGEYALLCLLLLLVRVLPERAWRTCGRGLGAWIGGGLGYRREVVDANLRQAFPGMEGTERRWVAAAMFRRLGEALFEFLALSGWNASEVRRHVPELDLSELEALRAEGRGAVLMTGHFGNWELMGAAVAARGIPIHVVARSQSNPWVDRLQNRIRERAGLKVIKAEGAAKQIVRAVRRGAFVAMLPDVNTPGGGVFVNFLGRTAATPRGVASIAWKLRCPIVSQFVVARGDGTHVGLVQPTIIPDPDQDEETAVFELTQTMAANLETCVRAHPDHYLWVHRRWKTRPAAGEHEEPTT